MKKTNVVCLKRQNTEQDCAFFVNLFTLDYILSRFQLHNLHSINLSNNFKKKKKKSVVYKGRQSEITFILDYQQFKGNYVTQRLNVQ